MLDNAACIDIYTQSHNLYPAQMFCDRLLSAGRNATCHESPERLVRTALATGANHAAVAISYSGLNQQLDALYGWLFARDYERSIAFLERSLPYTRLPGSDDAEPGQAHPRSAGTGARPSGTGPQSSHNSIFATVVIRGGRRAPLDVDPTTRIPPRQQPSWAPLCRMQTPRHVARMFRQCGSPVFRAARRAAPLRKWV